MLQLNKEQLTLLKWRPIGLAECAKHPWSLNNAVTLKWVLLGIYIKKWAYVALTFTVFFTKGYEFTNMTWFFRWVIVCCVKVSAGGLYWWLYWS
jgi:hypothetical protein